MMSRKRMLSGKRMLAGILTAVMVITSAPLPMSDVYAEEIAESVQEDESGSLKQESGEDFSNADDAATEDFDENEGTDVESPSQSDDIASGENTSDEEAGNPSDGEDSSDTDEQEPSDEENTPAEDDVADEDGEDGLEESDAGELYATGISDNDLEEPELQEIREEDELEGVYQFGGAPSESSNISVYSVSAYSVESSEAEKYLYLQMLERNTTIDISAYNIPYDSSGKEMLRSLVSGVLNEHPDLYFVSGGYSYWNNGTIITKIELTYIDTYDDAAFKQSVAAALSRVNDQMSDLEKAVVLHDYLTVNCEYDYQNYLNGSIPSESYSAYGTLVNNIAVCQGYALTYKFLLNQVGIDCYMVTSSSMNHAWNMIVLNGEYYQVDVTWDDPTWDKIGRSVHTYMFRSDAAFANHQDWKVTSGSEVVDYQATDTRYDNAFWTECRSPLVLAGDDCYYLSFDSTAYKAVIKRKTLADLTDSGITVQSIDCWTVWNNPNSYYPTAYSGLFQIGDRLYYNDKSSIYSIAMDGTDKRTEFTADTTTGYIYGSAYCQGKVLYALHQSPNENEKETVLTANITVEGSDPVDVPVQGVELNTYTLELAEGEEAELSATVYPAYATDSAVTWTSDDETVAAVGNGRVYAISVGSCIITATAGDKKAECVVQVTEGNNGAFDLTNLSYEYTTVDDTKISSAANGKPKLLIFYSNTCWNCRNTIQGISNAIDKFAGIDIYAMETNGGTKEEVIAFQQQYGCDEIVFSYDIDGTNASSMWAYAHTCGISGSISWPVICYIDADNRLQYITLSLIAADEVLSNLREYCNAEVDAPQIYKITYILNGGTNSSFNPSTYTSESDTIVLGSATRDGYRFEGWYKDSACTVRVTQIAKGSTGNITLYAKWSLKSSTDLPEIDIIPASGNVVMGFSGAYYTETADKILKRLNAIRLEACKEGVRNPSTGEPLTEADYVPLTWSSDLEAIARLRAAEAIVSQAHTRPNGQSCFSVRTTNGEQSWAENLAWNNSGLMYGIEQWYGEKNAWVNQTGETTGHYTSIISPRYNQVAVGAFRLSSGGWYSVAQEFSYKSGLDEQKNESHGSCVQYIEVQGSKVTKLVYGANKTAFIKEGDSCLMPVTVTVQYKDIYGSAKSYTGPYQAGGSWSSSDETVAVVDDIGNVTALKKGTAQISMTAGTKSVSTQITVYGRDESPIVVNSPNCTTYKVGQKINLAGGTVTYPSGSQTKTVKLTAAMISGFDSTKPGICEVQVTCGGYTTSFDTLIVEEPKLTASTGQSLSEVELPYNENGNYTWQDASAILGKAGIYIFTAVFTPKDETKFQKLTDIQVQVTAQETLGADTDVTFKTNRFTYNGTEQEPKVVVRASDTLLTEGQDYTLSYSNNKNAGIATVTIDGMGCYLGSISRTFEISPAQLVITAQDKTILIGDPIPAPNEYKYEVSGLMADDILITEPAVLCEMIVSSAEAGHYDIVPSGANAGDNYVISYVNGKLTVASEYVSCTVTFDVQGHGTAPADQIDVKVGSTINRPADPAEEGYRFDGWYQDAACTKVWNFDSDIVQSDMTLYAKWLGGSTVGEFAFQEIADAYYTGKACKPAVSVYDGDTLLRLGKDYQIKYYNNINANKDGVRKQGNGEGANFNPDLPYVEIIGKGNYTDRIKDGNKDTVKVNFNILRASIGDGTETPAAGVTLKVSEQLVTAKKVQKPFTSIKYVKGMKKDTDFNMSLTVENARDQSGRSLQNGMELDGAVVPAGYSGEFLLTVTGIGNYEGSICRKIYVTDKTHLIKNAKITLGKNLKNITFAGEPVQLKPAETDSADTFSVKYGKTVLKPGRDYTVSYRNNDKVGKAELIITGMGEYAGSKTATFNIKGRTFTAKTVLVEGIEDKVYTGRALTQNGVKLTYGTENEELRYGTDYTISYSRNINKGTATMTFKSLANAGYSGSFKKTFKINAADITQIDRSETMQTMQNKVFDYCKAGVKPVNEIRLINQEGFTLQNGKDYTLKYANNKAVAKAFDDKPPTVIVTGKGNYAGQFSLNFEIIRTDLGADSIQIKTTPVAYKANKAEDYAYKPAVKLIDGKTALRAGKDYTIAYWNNTQADYERYLQKLQETGDTLPQGGELTDEDDVPMAIITEAEGSSYSLKDPIIVPLPIYTNKLTKANLSVEIGEAVYTGNQIKPGVKVSYDGKLLREGVDYSLSYGANTASGKNKGSVVINGIAPNYGGSVTVKFNITKKPISY